jgi:hypothetical protein
MPSVSQEDSPETLFPSAREDAGAATRGEGTRQTVSSSYRMAYADTVTPSPGDAAPPDTPAGAAQAGPARTRRDPENPSNCRLCRALSEGASVAVGARGRGRGGR